MTMEEHKVLVTTSGIGSRLGSLTDFTNKTLVRVGDKPAISHIVENYAKETEFVITLGHYGEHVKDYLELAYPDRSFTFIQVDNYKGSGSSLLHSMKRAKNNLLCPFIFHACDAIVLDEIPKPDKNWIAGANVSPADQYRTLNVTSRKTLTGINEKGELTYDYAYPGLVGIKDFEAFWETLEAIVANDQDTQLSDCHVIDKMVNEKFIDFNLFEITQWHDIGEPSSLKKSRDAITSSIDVLDKAMENIYVLEDTVVKFFHNSETNAKRVQRAEVLEGLVPKLVGFKNNFFRYEYAKGDLFSKTVNPSSMKSFLIWCQENMWSKVNKNDITEACNAFYFDKTKKRAAQFLKGKQDKTVKINGQLIPPVENIVDKVDKNMMNAGISAIFHGDCILDNVIEDNGDFTLIDWRQDFAGSIDAGDVYYDLAKLNHNLIFNHDLVGQKKYTIEYSEDEIKCDILVSKNLLDCKDVLHAFIQESGYDLDKVKILTAIIWINMSPLHEHPLDRFLFNFGKYNLHRQIEKI